MRKQNLSKHVRHSKSRANTRFSISITMTRLRTRLLSSSEIFFRILDAHGDTALRATSEITSKTWSENPPTLRMSSPQLGAKAGSFNCASEQRLGELSRQV